MIQADSEPDGRDRLVAALGQVPPWRTNVLAAYAARVARPEKLVSLLQDLARSPAPASDDEVASIINALFQRGAIASAHALWRKHIEPAQGTGFSGLNNGDFEGRPSGLPFDWHLGQAVNAIVDITRDSRDRDNRALLLSFPGRRAQGIQVSQVLAAEAGNYELVGQIRGQMSAKRGLQWEIHCLAGPTTKDRLLARSDILIAKTPDWQAFRFAFALPSEPECAAQRLSLVHDARSASERLIGGEAWFDNLALNQVSPAAADPKDAAKAMSATSNATAPPPDVQPLRKDLQPPSLAIPAARDTARPAAP